jgi:hypothetical protein
MGRSDMRLIAASFIFAAPFSLQAAERTYSVTSFDSVRVVGPHTVIVETGRGVSARASGSTEAMDRVSVSVQGRVLQIRNNGNAWGGWPGQKVSANQLTIRITTPAMQGIAFTGSGKLDVDQMKGPRISIVSNGAGSVRVGQVETDQLSVTLSGPGSISIGGRAAQAQVTLQGSGTLAAEALKTTDLKLVVQGSASATIGASRSAKVTSTGSSPITIIGHPACVVNAVGAGEVSCGK